MGIQWLRLLLAIFNAHKCLLLIFYLLLNNDSKCLSKKGK